MAEFNGKPVKRYLTLPEIVYFGAKNFNIIKIVVHKAKAQGILSGGFPSILTKCTAIFIC